MTAATIRKSRTVRPGLVELLDAAAAIIEREAKSIRDANVEVYRNAWSADAKKNGAKRDYDEMRAVAKGLRAARDYHVANIFGGPAATFDGIADLIRAGDSVDFAMRVFGVEWSEPRAERKRLSGEGV